MVRTRRFATDTIVSGGSCFGFGRTIRPPLCGPLEGHSAAYGGGVPRYASGARRHAMISGHRSRGLANSEQRVAGRPIGTKPVSTAHCIPRAPQGAVSTNCRGPINRANYLPRPREPFKRESAWLADGATEGTDGVLVSRRLTLPSGPPRSGGVIR